MNSEEKTGMWRNLRSAWSRWRQPAWRGWLIDGVIFLVVIAGIAMWQTRGHIGGGTPAPDFVMNDLDGRTHQLADFRGKPVVMVWWAPWCGVCAQETGTLSALAEATRGDAHVISVVADFRTMNSVRQFVSKHGVDYPVLLAGPEEREAWGVESYPSIFFLDSEGRVARSVVGYTTGLGLRARLMLVD